MAKLCTVDDCDKIHRAKGLCVTHYNLANMTVDQRHQRVERPCAYCGNLAMVLKIDRGRKQFCSLICRDVWRLDQPGDRRPPRRVATRCTLPPDHPVNMICPLDTKWCKCCGQGFVCRPSARIYCSSRCSDRVKRKARGHRHLRRREDIFERDGYVCWICDEPTSDHYTQGDIWSPTIDHLMPVSLGGGDEPDNLATAHMWCNSVRGNSLDISPAA